MNPCTCAADTDGVDHEPFCALREAPDPIDADAVARAVITDAALTKPMMDDAARAEVARRLRAAAAWCETERGWTHTAQALRDLAVEAVYDPDQSDTLALVHALLGVRKVSA